MSKKKSSNIQAYFTIGVFIVILIVSILIYMKVLGNPANFENNDAEKGHPLNTLGIIYKGGFIVPILIAINLVIVTFFIERLITLLRARGTGNISNFVINIRELIAGDSSLDKEQKMAAIQKDLEESTSLELPMLSKNLVILSTCASIATLIGLIGTVLGMIRAFSALATSGAPDANALATGISEALINTALGITGSCIAIIFFNMFQTQIDRITYGIDEANFSILQTFAAKKH